MKGVRRRSALREVSGPRRPRGCRRRDRVILVGVPDYVPESMTRAEADALRGATVLQFGTNWCGICTRAEPNITEALSKRPDVRRVLVEDGPGRRLGRSFGIKLWPTLVMLRDGTEVARVVRPGDAAEIARALAQL